MASQFPKLFRQYYAIHETISRLVREHGGNALDETEIERRVKELHPDLEMGPATLKAAIRQALQDTESTVGRPTLSDQARVADQ
jgi:hypothetical protein